MLSVTIPSTVNTTEDIIKILRQYQPPDSKEDNKSRLITNITSLNLSESISVVTDQLLKTISGLLPSLRTLNLFTCTKITDAGLAHLRVLTSLQTLNLGWCFK